MALIVDDILLAPIKFSVWIAKKLSESAEKEMTDDSRIYEDLLDLQMRHELEEISDEEYDKQETMLMEKLEEIRKYKEEDQS
ncbi:MAG: gas vesicle protein GvpG [Desulfuromonadales bacterium C00003093]|nr:MAG: gas vesicle protein GvpG [Desulfuromonadales bacterium C00003093]